MNRMLVPVLVLLASSSTCLGGSFTISQNPADTPDFTNLTDAINATNGDATSDTLTILDSATYVESPPAIEDDLTITVAPGAAPTIEDNDVGGSNKTFQFNGNASGAGTLRIIGDSSTNTLRIFKNSADVRPIINMGPSTHQGNLVLENVTLERAAGLAGSFVNCNNFAGTGNLGNAEPHSLTNVDFVGGTGSTDYGVVAMCNGGQVLLDNCDFSAMTMEGNRLFVTSALVTATGCNLGHASANAPALLTFDPTPFAAGSATFSDCQFQSNDGRLMSLYTEATVTLTDPVFAGKCGDIAFWVPGAASTGSPDLTITGTDPQAKVSLNAMISGGTALPFRISRGSVTLENISASVAAGAGFADCQFEGALPDRVDITLDQCVFTNGAGGMILRASDGSGADVASSQPISLTATNTIFGGGLAGDAIIRTLDGGRTAPATISLTHCTLFGEASTLLTTSNEAGGQPATDVLTSQYCIYDDSAAEACAFSVVLNEANNIVRKAGSTAGGGFTLGEPAGLIVADPLLDASGRLQPGSPAIEAAVGSALPVDVDGDLRPQLTDPDMGADEWIFVNAAGDWELFQ